MKTSTMTILSAATLALAGCGQKASTTSDTGTNMSASMTTNDTPQVAAVATPGQTFANAAAASDAFEIATSRLAIASATSPSIKKYAEMMITAHTDSTAKLKSAASGASPAITPDPAFNAEQQSKLSAMQSMSGKAFDKAFVEAQVAGHQKTLDTLRAYSGSGDVPLLKSFASTLVPIVTAHLNMAKGLKA